MSKKVLSAILISVAILLQLGTNVTLAGSAAQLKEITANRRRGQYERAAQICRQVVTESPQTDHAFRAQAALVAVEIARTDRAQAETALRKLLTEFPGHKGIPSGHVGIPHAIHEITDLCCKMKKGDEIRQLYQDLLAGQQQSEQAVWLRMGEAISHAKVGDQAASDAALEQLLSNHSEDPRAAEALGQVAWCYRKQKKYEQAGALYQHVVDNWPDGERVAFSHRGLVICKLALGDEAGAWTDVQQLVSNLPANKHMPEVVSKIGDAYLDLKQYEKAEQLYQHVVDNYPNTEYAVFAKRGMVLCSLAQENDEMVWSAVQRMSGAGSDPEQMAKAIFDIGEAYRRLRKHEKARDLFRYIAESYPETEQAAMAQVSLAGLNVMSLIEARDDDAAQTALARLIGEFREHPHLPRVLHHIGNKYQGVKKFDRSEAVYRKFIEIDPRRSEGADVQVGIGWTLFVRGLYDQALVEYAKVAQNYPKSRWAPSGQYWIGQCYLKKGDFERALSEYQKVIDVYPESKQAGYAKKRIATIRSRQEAASRPDPTKEQSETERVSLGLSCGPAALVVMGNQLGIDLDAEEISTLAGADERGLTSMYGLAKAARANGLKATGVKINFEILVKLGKPVIAFVNGQHFEVVKEATREGVVTINQHGGEKMISKDNFQQTWQGYVLIVEKTPR